MSDQQSQMANTNPSSLLGGKRFFIVLFLFSNVVINDASGVGGGGCGLVGAARLWHVAVLFTVSCGTQSAAPAAPGAEVAAAQEGSNFSPPVPQKVNSCGMSLDTRRAHSRFAMSLVRK